MRQAEKPSGGLGTLAQFCLLKFGSRNLHGRWKEHCPGSPLDSQGLPPMHLAFVSLLPSLSLRSSISEEQLRLDDVRSHSWLARASLAPDSGPKALRERDRTVGAGAHGLLRECPVSSSH